MQYHLALSELARVLVPLSEVAGQGTGDLRCRLLIRFGRKLPVDITE